MRALCNVAYAVRAYGLEEKELKELDNELEHVPGTQKRGVSHNTEGLMAAFGMPKRS